MKKKTIGRMLAAITGLAIMISAPAMAKDASDYQDVQTGAWYYDYVADVSNKGLMTGLNETTFGVGQNLSRGQFATVLYRMSGEPAVNYDARFPDVPEGQFYSLPTIWASDKGIVTGYGNGRFGASDNITREQMATMLFRYANATGLSTDAREDYSGFPDSGSVSNFASEPMQWAVGSKIISGDGGKLNPQGNVSRAVCATMISRFTNANASDNENGGGNGNEGNEDGEKVWIVDKPAWVEEKPIYEWREHDICNTCQYDITKGFIEAGGEIFYDGKPNEKYQKFGDRHLIDNGCAGTHGELREDKVGVEKTEHPEEGHWE